VLRSARSQKLIAIYERHTQPPQEDGIFMKNNSSDVLITMSKTHAYLAQRVERTTITLKQRNVDEV